MTTPTLAARVKQMQAFACGLTEANTEYDRLKAMGDAILADVRELQEAAADFAHCRTIKRRIRLSEILRKTGGAT